jgi:hypothetical protein
MRVLLFKSVTSDLKVRHLPGDGFMTEYFKLPTCPPPQLTNNSRPAHNRHLNTLSQSGCWLSFERAT